jgi:hypothetical protein
VVAAWNCHWHSLWSINTWPISSHHRVIIYSRWSQTLVTSPRRGSTSRRIGWVTVISKVMWTWTPCRLVGRHQHIGVTSCLQLKLKPEVGNSIFLRTAVSIWVYTGLQPRISSSLRPWEPQMSQINVILNECESGISPEKSHQNCVVKYSQTYAFLLLSERPGFPLL